MTTTTKTKKTAKATKKATPVEKAEIRLRIDAKTKAKAEKLFKRFGMTTSDGVRMLIDSAVREKELPHVPNAKTKAALQADVEPMADDELAKIWNKA